MIDTLKIYIPQTQLPIDFFETVYKKFKNKRVTKKDTGEIWGTSTFHNFVCTHTDWGLSISGSFPKYYFGTNQYTLTKDDLILAIEQLGKELNIDLKDCSVTRIDVADNIVTKHEVESYYRYFGEVKGLKKRYVGEGIEYRNTLRTISIYDKTKELKRDGVPKIPIYEGKNVMRFEYRLMSGATIDKILKTPRAKVVDVINNYQSLITAWLNSFNSIYKYHNLMVFDPVAFSKGKEFENQLILAGISSLGGGQYILDIIKEARKMKLFKYNNKATNLSRRIKTILQSPVLTQKSTLIDELEKKVKIVDLVFSDHI